MPTYPSLQEHKPGDKVDLSNINIPVTERFTSSFSNQYEASQFNMLVNNIPRNVTPQEGYPGTFPITQEDIEKWKVDRPELPNIPIGLPKYIGNAVVSKYDNDKNLSLIGETKPNAFGWLGAFGGATVASFLDIKALITAAVTGGAGGKAAQTIGKWGMTKMGASEIFGSKAANIGTQIAQTGITFGAANVGYQTSRELQETESRDILQQPQHYLQSLQNIGMAGAEGVLLGMLGRGLSVPLFGRKVMRFEDGSFIDMPPETSRGTYAPKEGEGIPQFKHLEGQKWREGTEGGLFNRDEFNKLTSEQKKIVSDNFKPWTPQSDITMAEEATGQMFNGQVVNVDPIMKQGIADAGEYFRNAMREGNIDLEAFDGVLKDAHENIKTELSEAISQSEKLRESAKAYEAAEKLPITELSDLSQAGILKRAKLAQFEESIMKQSPELVPENVRKNIETQKEIDRLTRKIEEDKAKQLEAQPEKTAADIEPNKKVVKRIESLTKRQAKILKPKAELKRIRRELLTKAGTAEYGRGEAYQRLSELANVWRSARALKEMLDQHNNFETKVGELASHDFLVNALRDHVNGTHEGATHADALDYANNLQSTGIPEMVDTAAEFEPKPEKDIDAYMQEYSPEEAKSITDRVGDEAYTKEVEQAAKRVENIPKMREMVKAMTDCLMKGSI